MALVPSETKISKMRLGDLICENKFNIHPDKLINMEPKNGGSEDDFPFQVGDF